MMNSWKKSKKVIAMLMAASAIAGCGSTDSPVAGQRPSPQPTEETTVSTGAEDFQEYTLSEEEIVAMDKKFANAVNQFSYHVFEKLDNGENVFVSPYSMETAFSMLVNGAEGETEKEIMDLFGIKDLDKWNAYTKEYTSRYTDEDTRLLTANSAWLSDQINLSSRAEQEFFGPLSAYYHVNKKQVDLTTDETKEEINQWVSDNTNGMINPFLNENLGVDTNMVLINGVYFKGDWANQFKKEDTQKLSFNGANGETKTDMMCKYGEKFKYIEKHDIRGVEFPYEGDKIAMDILIPQEQDGGEEEQLNIKDCFAKLSDKEKDEIFSAFDEASPKEIFTLKIPKFTMEYSIDDLGDILKKMGLSTSFGQEADFSKIAEGISIDQVAHKAKIKVDEKGTEASAVTAIMEQNAIEETTNFIVDHPFIYVIRDIQTGTILFIGDMQDIN